MKGQFNGFCAGCQGFRPGCARVYFPQPGGGDRILCVTCRRANRGRYRLADTHRTGPGPVPALTEAVFTDHVIQLARLLGWRAAHFRAARTAQGWRTPCQGDAKGWPDVFLMRGPGHAVRLIVAELKVGANQPTAEQHAWLGAFEAAGVPAFVWRPEDWPEIERVLGEG